MVCECKCCECEYYSLLNGCSYDTRTLDEICEDEEILKKYLKEVLRNEEKK